MSVERIPVAPGRAEAGHGGYDILVDSGVLASAGRHLRSVLKRAKAFVVTDENVAERHLETLRSALENDGIACHATVLPSGERTKDFTHLERLCGALLEAGAERSDTLVALGGGVIGDLTGFVAAILRRGMDFVQVPTTLLAQVDSSVGGKTGIDTAQGKNLVGAFHQPRLVLADTDTLDTLPRRELLAGYAEVAKYGLLGDRAFFEWLEQQGPRVVSDNGAERRQAIVTSCRAKADIVARDETETGERALLNLGHTFGHALEAEAGFDARLLHGEAVAIGMVMAFGLSARIGLCSPVDAERVHRHLASVGLPVHPAERGLAGVPAGRLVARMAQDKKVRDGRVTFVLVRGIGEAFLTRDIEPAVVASYLTDLLERPPERSLNGSAATHTSPGTP